METKKQSDLLVGGAHWLFFKNEHFQSWIVILIIFDCSHSDLAQKSIFPSICSFYEKFYK